MRGCIEKWGDSLAVRLPPEVVEAAGLREGMPLDLTIRDGALILSSGRWDIRTLVARITSEPPPLEMESPPRGGEVW